LKNRRLTQDSSNKKEDFLHARDDSNNPCNESRLSYDESKKLDDIRASR